MTKITLSDLGLLPGKATFPTARSPGFDRAIRRRSDKALPPPERPAPIPQAIVHRLDRYTCQHCSHEMLAPRHPGVMSFLRLHQPSWIHGRSGTIFRPLTSPNEDLPVEWDIEEHTVQICPECAHSHPAEPPKDFPFWSAIP